MIGIIVTGHNRFADGVSSTVEMIAGKQEHYLNVNFLDGSSHEALHTALFEAVKTVNQGKGVLVFTDLKGGTPFQQAVMIAMNEPNVEVLTGTNIAMLLEGTLMRGGFDDVGELAKKLVETGLQQVSRFDKEDLMKRDVKEDEDGI